MIAYIVARLSLQRCLLNVQCNLLTVLYAYTIASSKYYTSMVFKIHSLIFYTHGPTLYLYLKSDYQFFSINIPPLYGERL